MTRTKSMYLALLAVLLSPMAALADPIIEPVSVSVTFPLFPGFLLNSGNDQSGLSAGYTSGVTDFDTDIALNPTHDNGGNTTFASE